MHRLLRRAPRPSRPAPFLVILVVLLVGHGLALYYASSHLVVSAAVLSAVGILVLVKHARLLGGIWRRRRSAPDQAGAAPQRDSGAATETPPSS